jgi:hypothetical protein
MSSESLPAVVKDARATEGGSAEASAPAPSLKIDTDQVARLEQNGIHLIWSGPTEGDAESGWMLEAYSDERKLLDLAVAGDPTDALPTIIESLLPSADPA